MNIRVFYTNFVNKIPKILLLLVVLFALARHRQTIFGNTFGKNRIQTAYTLFDREAAADYFGQEVLLSTRDSVWYEVRFDANDPDVEGYIVCGDRSTNSSRGFGGTVPVAVFLDAEMIITGVGLLENQETPEFVEQVQRSGLLERWNGQHLYDAQVAVDAVSGATYTSQAVIANVRNTLDTLLDRQPLVLSGNRFAQTYLGEFAILLVVIFSLISFLAPGITRKLRIPLLVASLLVLGVWQGAFVSLDLLYKWFIYGTSPLARFGIFTFVALALVLPLLTNKSFYCAYLCPFGAAQELIGKARRHPCKVPRGVIIASRWIRRAFLVTVVVLLLTLPQVNLAGMEPFTIFLIRAAAVSSVIIAAVSLLASFFFTRPWCRLLCPTGEVLSILRRPVTYPRWLRRHKKHLLSGE